MIGIAEFNSAIGRIKNHTEITGHNCGLESLKILTPDLAYHSAGGEYRCSYLSIELQICNLPGNKKGSTANATSLNRIFLKYQLNQSVHNIANLCWRKVQPFGSIPCRNSSLRARSFSQLPRLTFSLSAAASNCSLNSGTSLILNIGDFPAPFGLLSLFTVDMYRPVEIVLMLLGLYTNTFNLDRTTPRSATNTIEASNHNVNRGNSMAMYKSTQTHPKFKWRFFSCQQSRYFTVEARSEQEARSMLPDAPCLFSARIRQGVNHA